MLSEARLQQHFGALELALAGSGIPSFYNMNRIGNKSFLKIEPIAF